jgi:hypothetical protein
MRTNVEMPQKSALHSLARREAGEFRNRLQWEMRLFELAARDFDPRALDESGGRHAGLRHEAAREIARAHRHLARQALDRKVLVGVAENP